jgi:hypothetical protein
MPDFIWARSLQTEVAPSNISDPARERHLASYRRTCWVTTKWILEPLDRTTYYVFVAKKRSSRKISNYLWCETEARASLTSIKQSLTMGGYRRKRQTDAWNAACAACNSIYQSFSDPAISSDSDSDWSPKFGLALDSGSDFRNRDFPTTWPTIISQWNTYDVLTIVDICACGGIIRF